MYLAGNILFNVVESDKNCDYINYLLPDANILN